MVMSSTETSHNFTLTSSSSTLQPWRATGHCSSGACDQPHSSGPLVGVKVAEAALNGSLDGSERARRLDAEAQAHVPGGQRDFAMVLVLASGNAGHYTQVHDFANYPARQQFATPHLDGRVGYRIVGDDVVLEAERIRSPRASDNVSGSLRLELWALAEAYRGGTFDGHALGHVDLGRLAGQHSLDSVAERVRFSPPPAGNWKIVMMLREWAGPAGYVTRDFARFAVDYTVSEPTPVSETKIAAAIPQPREDSTAVRVPVVVDRRPARLAVNRATVVELAAIKGLSRKVATEIVKGRPIYKSFDALISRARDRPKAARQAARGSHAQLGVEGGGSLTPGLMNRA